MSLPPLPTELGQIYNPSILEAVQKLNSCYFTAFNVVTSGNFDAQRLEYHIRIISDTVVPLLMGLEEIALEQNIPQFWLMDCVERFKTIVVQILQESRGISEHHSTYVKLHAFNIFFW